MPIIESPQNERVKLARSLHESKGRRESGLLLAEGPACVAEALLYAPGIQWVAWCEELGDEEVADLAASAQEAGIAVVAMAERAFRALSDTRSPQGIAAVLRQNLWSLDALRPPDGAATYLVLHEVRDPGNLGSMIRSADAFGANGVLLSGSCVDPYDPKVVRATAGSLFHIPVAEADWEQVESWAADHGIKLLGADLEAQHELGNAALARRIGFVIGNEAHGLPQGVLQGVAFTIKIPMYGAAESLNAAGAAAVLLYEAARSRQSAAS